MSSPNSELHKTFVKFLRLILMGIPLTGFLAAQSRSIHSHNCAEYHKERVLFLLHCCGDVEKVFYPGAHFIGDLTDSMRANLALREINIAMRTCSENRLSPDYLSLQLDAAGAELMKARAIATENRADWNEASVSAERATTILKRFYHEHPAQASSVWKTIEHWLHESGGPWQALDFMSSLPSDCCSKSDVAKIRGDLFMEVNLRTLAAQSYSEWIKIGGIPPDCGAEATFLNIEILHGVGFDLPVLKKGQETSCINTGYSYYVIFPPKAISNP